MSSVNKKKLIDRLNIYRFVLILLVICIFVTILSPSLLSVANLFNVSKQITVADIVGYGMTFIILTEGIDLSVGFILGLTGILASGILKSTGNAGAAILMASAVDIGCGTVSGFFVAVYEAPPFISTLGMMALLRGCIPVYTKDSPIPTKVDAYEFFSKGTVAGVPVPVIVLIILLLIAHYMPTWTSYDYNIYTFGGNREAVRLSGISVRSTEWVAHTLSNPMCDVAGVILTARPGSAQPTSSTGIETGVVAAVILGDMSLSGGMGFMLSAVVGTTIMGIIDSILILMNVNPHATNIVKNAAIPITVLMDKEVKDLSVKAE